MNPHEQVTQIMALILGRGGDRMVFLVEHQLVSFPAGGLSAQRMLNRRDAVWIGTYDCAADRRMILEDASHVACEELED